MTAEGALDGTVRREWVRCGKQACKRCKGQGHGPYWYSYYRQDGKLRKEYIGRWLPQEYVQPRHVRTEPVAYKFRGSYYHKECIAAQGYYGENADKLLARAGIQRVAAFLENRNRLLHELCGQCGKPMKSACR